MAWNSEGEWQPDPDPGENWGTEEKTPNPYGGDVQIGGKWYHAETKGPTDPEWAWHPSAQAYAQTLIQDPNNPGRWLAPVESWQQALQGTYQGGGSFALDPLSKALGINTPEIKQETLFQTLTYI